MSDYSTNRGDVLRTVRELIDEMETRRSAAGARGDTELDEELEKRRELLQESVRWAEVVEPVMYEDPGASVTYSSNDETISMVQTAIEAYQKREGGGKPPAGRLLRYVEGMVRKIYFGGKEPFIDPRPYPSTRIAEECRIALVGDWGTGLIGAIHVAEAIRDRKPDHVIHLGDIYHIGARSEAREKFVDIWTAHGPPDAKYWSIPGNHDFYSEGKGYFDVVLKFCDQEASCFALENEHWRIIGVDTAYKDADLYDGGQIEWLKALLKKGVPAKILLTHHQPVSVVDKRPLDSYLHSTMSRHFNLTNVYAWFCGHEHRTLVYDDPAQFHGCRLRCIGHGGQEKEYVPLSDSRLKGVNLSVSPEFERVRPGPSRDGKQIGMNGFALLTLKKERIVVEHIDETNFTWHTEEWRA